MNPFGTIYQYDVSGAIGARCLLPTAGREWYTAPIPEASAAYAAAVSYQPSAVNKTRHSFSSFMGIALLAVAAGGIAGPLVPQLRLESQYRLTQAFSAIQPSNHTAITEIPKSVPILFDPLMTPDGGSIEPISEDFAIIVPKVGINANVIENVDPGSTKEYLEALKEGVAHASTSFLPNEDGTVYLFSHSTNYDWFVKDLNAVFYHLKNLDKGDTIVLVYKGSRYTYEITGKQVVSPRDISYLVPDVGKKSLILQTCWPPGSLAQRLLIFADLVKEQTKTI